MKKAWGITSVASLLLIFCIFFAVVSDHRADAYSPPTTTPTDLPPPPPTTPIEPTSTSPVETPTTTQTIPDPTVPTTTNPNNNPNWGDYDPKPPGLITQPSGSMDGIYSFSGISDIEPNPGGEFDFSTQDPDGQIPEPPLPPQNDIQSETTSSQDPNEQIWIVLLDGTFSINTEKPQVDNLAYYIIGSNLVNNIGQTPNVYIGQGSAEVLKYLQQEQDMFNAGMIDPETPLADFNLYGGNKPSYYVTGSTHISGDLSNPQNQSAVAIFTYQVIDANGNVVYQNKITGVSSEGKTLADYWYQAAPDVNAYLESVINK